VSLEGILVARTRILDAGVCQVIQEVVDSILLQRETKEVPLSLTVFVSCLFTSGLSRRGVLIVTVKCASKRQS
jgi:hypothetical protein